MSRLKYSQMKYSTAQFVRFEWAGKSHRGSSDVFTLSLLRYCEICLLFLKQNIFQLNNHQCKKGCVCFLLEGVGCNVALKV